MFPLTEMSNTRFFLQLLSVSIDKKDLILMIKKFVKGVIVSKDYIYTCVCLYRNVSGKKPYVNSASLK